MEDIDMDPKPQPSGGDVPPGSGIDSPPPPPAAEIIDRPPDPLESEELKVKS